MAMSNSENRPVEWVATGKGRLRPITHACPFCGKPRDEMHTKKLPGHLPRCKEKS